MTAQKKNNQHWHWLLALWVYGVKMIPQPFEFYRRENPLSGHFGVRFDVQARVAVLLAPAPYLGQIECFFQHLKSMVRIRRGGLAHFRVQRQNILILHFGNLHPTDAGHDVFAPEDAVIVGRARLEVGGMLCHEPIRHFFDGRRLACGIARAGWVGSAPNVCEHLTGQLTGIVWCHVGAAGQGHCALCAGRGSIAHHVHAAPTGQRSHAKSG